MHIITQNNPQSTPAERPAENLCQIPGCHRQAYRIDRGVVVCAVCWLIAQSKRRRGW